MIDTPDYSLNQQKNQESIVSSTSSWQKFLRLFIYALLIVLGGGLSYSWYFLSQKLVPLLETPVSNFLSMEIDLGKVEAISFNSLRLGKSEIKTNQQEGDYVVAEGVEISLNWWELLQQKIALDIEVIQPLGYLQQNEDKSWLNLNLKTDNFSFYGFSFGVDKISITDGLLSARSINHRGENNNLTQGEIDYGSIQFNQNQSWFNVEGKLVNGGKFTVDGVNHNSKQQWLIDITSDNLPTDTLTQLNLFNLPINLKEGNLAGNLSLQFTNSRLDNIKGLINLNQVNLEIPSLSQTLTNTSGKISLHKENININNIVTDFGLIPATGKGLINYETQELDLAIETETITINDAISTFNLPQPVVKTEGKVKGEVTVTGKLSQPLVTASIENVDNLTIDEIEFSQGEANISVFDSQLVIDDLTLNPVIGGKVTGEGKISLADNNPIFNLSLETNAIEANKLANIYQQNLPTDIGLLSGKFNLTGSWQELNQTLITGFTSFPLADGKVTINDIRLQNQQWQGDVNLSEVNLTQLAVINNENSNQENEDKKINPSWLEKLEADTVFNGNFQVSGNLQERGLNYLNLVGNGNVNFAESLVKLENINLNNGNWQTQVTGDNLAISAIPWLNLDNLTSSKTNNSQSASFSTWQKSLTAGKIDGKLTIKGNLDNPSFINIAGEGIGKLPQGKVKINSFTWIDDNLTANLSVNQFPLTGLGEDLRGDVTGSIVIEKGKTDGIQNELELARQTTAKLNSALPVNQKEKTQPKNHLVSNLDNQSINNSQVNNSQLKIKGDLNFSKGISLINQPLEVVFAWDGDNKIWLDSLSSQGISATGLIDYDINQQQVKQVDLNINAEDVSLTQLPLPSQLNLLEYKGKIDFQGKLVGDFSQPQLTGNVNLKQFSLANLAFDNLAGEITANSQIGVDLNLTSTSKLTYNLNSTSNLNSNSNSNSNLTNSSHQDKLKIQLDKNYQPQLIDIATGETVLTAILQKNNSHLLDISINNFPLSSIPLTNLEDKLSTISYTNDNHSQTSRVGGDLFAEIEFDLDNGDFATSELIINQPRVNHLQGDLLTAKVASQQGKITISEGKLTHQENEYNFSANWQPNWQPDSNNPQFEAEVTVSEGDIQDVLTSLQIFQLSDFSQVTQPRNYAKAEDLYNTPSPPHQPPTVFSLTGKRNPNKPVNPVVTRTESKDNSENSLVTRTENKDNLVNSVNSASINNQPLAKIDDSHLSLLERIDFVRQINQRLEEKQNQQEENSALPPLENLDGKFTGKINLAFSPEIGVNANFDFQGNQWQWGKYQADFLQAKGSYKNGLLTLLPIQIKQNDGIIALTGTFQPERILGQIIIDNLPISEVGEAVNIPNNISLDGKVNGNIAISGTQKYPLAKGTININEAQVNNSNIDLITSNFDYKNSRLTFFTNSNLHEDNRTLMVTGNIPFQLFNNSVKPEKNDFNINLDINKNGFKLLDIISNNQLNWITGDGNISLDIMGTYQQRENKIRNIKTQGIIDVNNGIISANIFPDKPLTNINGKVLFNFDQLTIPNLTGNFSGGEIDISGNLPLTENKNQQQNLDINLDNIALNLESLYQGEAEGEIAISGKAIQPEISGKIELFNGEINLSGNKGNHQEIETKSESLLTATKIKNLELILGENISINQLPLLRLKATGNLNLTGNLQVIKPEGLIDLKSGTINLFTSQLKLAPSYENTARFTSENLFNPYLDLELEGSVTETSRHQFVDNSNSNEIKDLSNSTINTAQTIRVKAKVKGASNNIEKNLELSSSPHRNQSEIIALLGGGFFNNFAQGNNNLGLANLASAAFLGSFQGQLGEALGFDEFRFFPTQILDPDERTSSLGFGAEIGLDLTDNFSVSVFKILTHEQQPQYSIRYRLNDQINLRTSTDFADDSRGAIEFQYRF